MLSPAARQSTQLTVFVPPLSHCNSLLGKKRHDREKRQRRPWLRFSGLGTSRGVTRVGTFSSGRQPGLCGPPGRRAVCPLLGKLYHRPATHKLYCPNKFSVYFGLCCLHMQIFFWPGFVSTACGFPPIAVLDRTHDHSPCAILIFLFQFISFYLITSAGSVCQPGNALPPTRAPLPGASAPCKLHPKFTMACPHD